MKPAATPSHDTSSAEPILVGGCRVHHVDAGPREAPAVVLLHGIVATHRYFRANLDALAARHRVLAPDLPGSGRSDKPDAAYSTDWYVAQLAAFLDAKGVGRAHLVGNSMGGQIALAFAHALPARVERLVLVAPAGLSTSHLAPLRPFLRVAHRHGHRLVPRIPEAALAALFHIVFPGRPDLARRYIRGYASGMASEEYPLYVRALLRSGDGVLAHGTARLAREILHPTLIVWGRRDALLPAWGAKRLARAMPHAELRIYDRSGHCPMIDEPERFNRDVIGFLNQR
jgi:pimeloyl-ACP methyl ester carboxylesterase